MLQAPGRSVPEGGSPSAEAGTEPTGAKVTAEPPKGACYTTPTGLHQSLASTDEQPDQRL